MWSHPLTRSSLAACVSCHDLSWCLGAIDSDPGLNAEAQQGAGEEEVPEQVERRGKLAHSSVWVAAALELALLGGA